MGDLLVAAAECQQPSLAQKTVAAGLGGIDLVVPRAGRAIRPGTVPADPVDRLEHPPGRAQMLALPPLAPIVETVAG